MPYQILWFDEYMGNSLTKLVDDWSFLLRNSSIFLMVLFYFLVKKEKQRGKGGMRLKLLRQRLRRVKDWKSVLKRAPWKITSFFHFTLLRYLIDTANAGYIYWGFDALFQIVLSPKFRRINCFFLYLWQLLPNFFSINFPLSIFRCKTTKIFS